MYIHQLQLEHIWIGLVARVVVHVHTINTDIRMVKALLGYTYIVYNDMELLTHVLQ